MARPKATESKDMAVIEARYHPLKDWKMDASGYFLIRVNPETGKLEAGFCRRANVIETKVVGDTPEEVCFTIIRKGLTADPQHAAYLGRELQKAALARDLGIAYVQDDPLHLAKG